MAAVKKNENAMAVKKDANQKIKERRQKIDQLFKGSEEPTINPIDYKVSLIQAMNWYNVFISNKEKQVWALQSIIDLSIKKSLEKLDDHYFMQVGALIRLKETDNFLDDKELDYIDKKIKELIDIANVPVVKVTVSKKVVPKQDKNKILLDDFISDIDGEIDQYISDNYPKVFTFKHSPKVLNGQVAKQVPAVYKNLIQELEEVLGSDCEQLNDSYSNVKTIQVKRFLQLMKNLVASCTQQVISAKTPKTVKPKAPSVLVSKMKYLPKFEELSLTSENPVKIIGSSTMILYDTTKRLLSFYEAAKDGSLSVKGTTIIGYDVESSGVKLIKSIDILADLKILNKKQIAARFNAIRTKPRVPNGRTNINEIILKVFK